MNYKQIHDNMINYCKRTTPRSRLELRNIDDQRLSLKHLYVEVHHIIPRSLGGSDAIENLVTLLPEEHILIHMLRWKIYNNRNDILAVRFCLNGYSKNKTCKPIYHLTKPLRMGYAWLKQQSRDVRMTTGWQSPEGRKRISEARRGKLVVKDANTGIIVGSVDSTHPKILCGEWVHHTKGRVVGKEERLKLQKRSLGLSNSNSCKLPDKYFIDKGIELSREFNRVLSWGEMCRFSRERNFTWMVACGCRFNRRGPVGFVDAVKLETGLSYDEYFTRRNNKQINLC